MKYYMLFVLSVIALDLSAQSWRYRNNGTTDYDTKRARAMEENNRRVTRQNMQRYEQQERANQQRREARQKEYMQEQERANQQRRESRQREYIQQPSYSGSLSSQSGEQPRERTLQQYNSRNVDETKTVTAVRSNENTVNQSNDKVVTLVANGTGRSKKEATENALRSAIEQAFGTFVSANTTVLNDDLIKDEIVTVSTGSIKSYRELSSSQSSSGLYDVSVHATVSIDQLTKFAQSKGMQVELAGASFTMNMKMRELNKKNEVAAIDHMIEKAKAIAQNGLFDYKLEIGEPKLTSNSQYAISLKVLFLENANTKAFYESIDKTLQALSLSQKEQQEYRNAGLEFYWYNSQLDNLYGKYALRNKYPCFHRGSSISRLLPIIVENALNYVIHDNLGNQITCMRRKTEPATSSNPLLDYITNGNGTCVWYYLDKDNQILRFYELRPKDRIARVNHGYERFPAIPLIDFSAGYNEIGTDISFNPIVDSNGNLKRTNNPQRIYYYQEFFVLYSEAELSRLTSIKIDHRQ